MESAQHPKLDLEKQVSNIIPEEMEKVLAKPSHSAATSSTTPVPHVAPSIPEKEEERAKGTAAETPAVEEEPVYPSKKKLIPIMGSLYLSFFLIALVRLPPLSHLSISTDLAH